jgi:CRISPR-associated protein Cas7/Cst2/DevR subtype I-B
MCDLFGYMNPEELGDKDEIPTKRYSPLRVTPLLGQYSQPVTTDMILRYDVEDEEGDLDHNIGYREMTENVFRGAFALDVPAIGRRETEELVNGDDHDRYKRTYSDEIEDTKRAQRVSELLTAIQNTSQLAGQARHMADFMPDFVVAAAMPTYNQRVSNSIRVDSNNGEVNADTLRSVLTDLINLDATVWVAGTHNPAVMNNWEEVFDVATSMDDVSVEDSVSDVFREATEEITSVYESE